MASQHSSRRPAELPLRRPPEHPPRWTVRSTNASIPCTEQPAAQEPMASLGSMRARCASTVGSSTCTRASPSQGHGRRHRRRRRTIGRHRVRRDLHDIPSGRAGRGDDGRLLRRNRIRSRGRFRAGARRRVVARHPARDRCELRARWNRRRSGRPGNRGGRAEPDRGVAERTLRGGDGGQRCSRALHDLGAHGNGAGTRDDRRRPSVLARGGVPGAHGQPERRRRRARAGSGLGDLRPSRRYHGRVGAEGIRALDLGDGELEIISAVWGKVRWENGSALPGVQESARRQRRLLRASAD